MMDATQSEIEEALTCQCGCGLTVHACNHLNCPSGIPLKQEIADELRQGLTRVEVLDHFRLKYGEKILSAPTTTGFNLVAWVTPFAAVLIALLVIILVSRRWRRSGPAAVAPAAAVSNADAKQRAVLETELRRYDG